MPTPNQPRPKAKPSASAAPGPRASSARPSGRASAASASQGRFAGAKLSAWTAPASTQAPTQIQIRLAGARIADCASGEGSAAPAAAACEAPPASGMLAGFPIGEFARRRARHTPDVEELRLARVGPQHLKTYAVEVDRVAASRHPPEGIGHEAADGIEVGLRVGGAEAGVELLDLGERLDAKAAVGLGDDVFVLLVKVVFVVYVADDLLEHVLDRDHPGDAA